jgi:drug/metabolite transporter (DMT)-like permease
MSVARGLIAGAAGTVTLNVLTYLDMAVRGRPASSVPAETVEEAAEETGADLAHEGDEDAGQNRSQGIGALLGYASGLGFGALYGALRDRRDAGSVSADAIGLALAAMAGASLPSTVMGVTDPRKWGAEGWIADIVPHLAYGFVTASVYDTITDQ